MSQSVLDRLKISSQYVVPQHLLSRLAGLLAESRWPLIKNTFIDLFINHFDVDMSQALEQDPHAYSSFNEFFTRGLKEGARPITSQGVACPADGAVSQLGRIDDRTERVHRLPS